MDSVYCYPNSDVLINKLNITNEADLKYLERKITAFRKTEILSDAIVPSKFDFAYLKKIHKKLFGDIYDWAGQTRIGNIGKGGSVFCVDTYIDGYAKTIFDELKKDGYLQGLKKPELVDKLAFYFSETNTLHPFREGNGRTQRTFFEKLLCAGGHEIAFDKVDGSLWIHSNVLAMNGDLSFLKEILHEIVSPMGHREKSLETMVNVAKQEAAQRNSSKDKTKLHSRDNHSL